MSEKRKDNKGRLLRTGESQRKDLSYMYRYKDNDSARKSVYAPTLAELREKEEEIAQRLRNGVVVGKKMTAVELVDAFLRVKQNIKDSTAFSYRIVFQYLKRHPLGGKSIQEISKIDVKSFFVDLKEEGYHYGTLKILLTVMRQAFEQAVDDNFIQTNPCAFRLKDVMRKEQQTRNAISAADLKELLDFAKICKYNSYYNEIALIAYTGIRVSEACALTIDDIDFENNVININKQTVYLCRDGHYERKVETPKTPTSIRSIPMNATLRSILKDCIFVANERTSALVCNGYKNFLFLGSESRLQVAREVEDKLNQIVKLYNKKHNRSLPRVTPHVLRHTFCTESIVRGMDPKSVQYILGHSSSAVTMDVYTHVRQSDVHKAFAKAYGS